jgi:putative transposase
MKYDFIERELYPVRIQCKFLEVHPSGYYKWRKTVRLDLGKRRQANRELLEAIQTVYQGSEGRYGAPRVTAVLRQRGHRCSRGRVGRLMKANRIKAIQRRAYRVTTHSDHALASPNLLERCFRVLAINRVWTTDITYVATREGWLYVAIVLDLYSRKIVGLAMGSRLSKELVCDALNQAITQRNPPPGLLLHSDRGTQYSASQYRAILQQYQMKQSMSRKGNCWDNAPAESFFKTLKLEQVYRHSYQTRSEAAQSIFRYIEVFYNRQRVHSTLNYQTPVNFEDQATKSISHNSTLTSLLQHR